MVSYLALGAMKAACRGYLSCDALLLADNVF